MNPRHNENAPLNTSFVNSTQAPRPPSNGGGGSGIRGGTPRRRRRPRGSSAHFSPNPPPMWSPMYQPPPYVFPFGSQPPMSPAPSWLPYYRPAPVAYHYNAASPPLPFTRPTTLADFGGRVPQWNAHTRGNGGNVYSGLSPPMRPQSADRMICPRPVEMPVGVMPNEGPGDADDGTNVLLTDYMDPDKIFYVYSEDDLKIILGDSENVKSSGSENSNLNGHKSPYLPHSPVNHHGLTKWVDGNENALSDPKHAERILPNWESSAPSNAKKVRRVQDLEEKVIAFECEADVPTGNSKLREGSLSALDDENKQLRIGADGLQEQLSRRNVLNEQLTEEDLRLDMSSGEVMLDISGFDMSNWELDANMLQTFSPSQLDQLPQPNRDFNEHII
ncbi:hypothetical protein Bca4012_022954 [Brassica carinata]|uniref:Uncharacterized protein n=1 Tax=Brassica carinata TaxID=52824 RepID=A0A8X7NVV4_BRACI|nr:hypothetical protein Bca52824_091396 [Brassica carinata]